MGFIIFIYLYFGDDVTFIIEKLHEAIPHAIAI